MDKIGISVNYGAEGTYGNLVRVKNDIVLGGDSGGPVFMGGKAIGVISGHGTYFTGQDTPVAHHFTLYAPIGPIKATPSNGGMDLVVKTG